MEHQAPLICAALKQNRKKEKREKIREKEEEKWTARRKRKELEDFVEKSSTKGKLGLIIGFEFNWF